ncbi:MAG: GNAT family N-acetyltransferase [Solirubrobacteraceae bacterium]
MPQDISVQALGDESLLAEQGSSVQTLGREPSLAEQNTLVQTLGDETSFAELSGGWDALVAQMPRPSAFLCHAWLYEWWRHYGRGRELQLHVARRGGRLVGALPLGVSVKAGVRVAKYLGGQSSALADVMTTVHDSEPIAAELLGSAARAGNQLLDVFGAPQSSRLARALAPYGMRQVAIVEAPVLEMPNGWEAAYRAKTTSKQRNLHGRRRRQLAKLGRLEVTIARSPDELAPALEEAFAIHELRWRGRPDHSDFATPTGMRFHRAALLAMSEIDAPRIVTLRLDGRAIAFHYYFKAFDTMFVHRLGFDPEFARYSPGLVNTLDALAVASDEGARRVEFLGGGERYKLELADRLEPMHRVVGIPRGAVGHALAHTTIASTRARLALKRNPAVNRFYYERFAPARARLSTGWARLA